MVQCNIDKYVAQRAKDLNAKAEVSGGRQPKAIEMQKHEFVDSSIVHQLVWLTSRGSYKYMDESN